MRHTKSVLVVLGLVLVVGACSDSKNPAAPTAPNPNLGTWIGTYGSGAATTPADYTFYFFAGDSMHVIDGLPPFDSASGAVGTWKQTDSTISGSYVYPSGPSFSIVGVLSASTGAAGTTLTGTWGATPPTTGGGGFVVVKQ